MRLVGSRGEFPYHEGKHLIVIVKEWVYADEAGTHDASVYCIVAGYRASPRQWKKFNEEWRTALKNAQVPEFHANVFFNRKTNKNPRENHYLKWSDSRAEEFLGVLLDAISKRWIHPVGCGIDVPAFHALGYGDRCALTGQLTAKDRRPPSPYLFAFTTMLSAALEDTHPDTEVHFRFGLHPGYKGRALDIFDYCRESGFGGKAKQLAGIEFYPTTTEPGLQAADLIAHQWYNTSVRKGRLNQENIRVMNALTRRRNDMTYADAASLQRVLKSLRLTPEQQEYLRNLRPPECR